MSPDPLLIAVFLLAALGGTALIAFAVTRGRKTQQALAEMAARNGWSFTAERGDGGRASRMIISDDAAQWRAVLYYQSTGSAGSTGGSVTRWTMFEDPSVPAPTGTAIVGPEIPEKTRAMADKMMGTMGGDIARYFLDKMTGDLGAQVQDLRSVPGEGPGTLFATPGAEGALDPVRFAPELENARAGLNEMQQPIVMRGPFGLRIKLARYLKKPDEMEDFIRMGQALVDNLSSGN